MNIMANINCPKCSGQLKIYVPGINVEEGGVFLHVLALSLLLDETSNLIVKDSLVESKLMVNGKVEVRPVIEHDKSLANLLVVIKREMERQRRETEFERAHELQQLQKYMGYPAGGGPWGGHDVS